MGERSLRGSRLGSVSYETERNTAPIDRQYYTDLPFEGHHREYTQAEVDWMLREAGHAILSIETFNYSMFGQTAIVGEHADYARQMDAHPDLRELIFVVSRRL